MSHPTNKKSSTLKIRPIELPLDIKFVVFDFDGVFTDGKIYYSANGDSFKSFNFHDGYGLILLKKYDIKVGLITGHDTPIIENMDRFISRFDCVYKGSRNKLDILDAWRKDLNLEWENIAFMGDDGPDTECMMMCGLSGTPNDGTRLAKQVAQFTSEHIGGDGAAREFVEFIIDNNVSQSDSTNVVVTHKECE